MECSYTDCQRPVASSFKSWVNNGGSMPRPQDSGTRGRCAEHGAWAKCKEHWYLKGCPYCSAAAQEKWDEEQRQERERASRRRQEEEAESAKVPLEERARRAAEKDKQEQAARWQAQLRALQEEMVPRARAIVRERLGVDTDTNDWNVNPDALLGSGPSHEYVTIRLQGVGIRVQRAWHFASELSGSGYSYGCLVWNQAKQQYDQLTLASFGEALNANEAAERARAEVEENKAEQKPGHSGYPAMRDFWSMLLATLNDDAQAVQAIWEKGDHLAMMSWAFGAVLDLLHRCGDDPETFARFVIERSLKEEAAETSRKETG